MVRSAAASILEDRTVFLISDRPDQAGELARLLGRLYCTQTIDVDGRHAAVASAAAVVIDINFSRRAAVESLRSFLSTSGLSTSPIIAVLRGYSHLERVQAAALGACAIFSAGSPFAEIRAALESVIHPNVASAVGGAEVRPAVRYIERSGRQFAAIFRAAARGDAVDRQAVDDATRSIIGAVAKTGIREWLDVIRGYDDATYQHCMLVSGLAAAFAESLRLALADQTYLVTSALLHDIGKAKIPLAILNKPGALTPDEFTIVRTHAKIGYDLLREQGGYEARLLDVVLHHHELLDGSGYPDGLVGSKIADPVRLVTICDIYAALIERRPYRPPMKPVRAFGILQEMEGKLEGALVKAFEPVVESVTVSD
jgi:putative nucleotidyltransferase with HDIG domain